MKIALPYQNGQVFPHFGHAPQFKFYTIESGMILHTEVVETAGSGPGYGSLRARADAAADQRVNAAAHQKGRHGAVAAARGLDDLGV